MGECIFTGTDWGSEGRPYGVDIWHDGATNLISPTNVRDALQVPAGIFLPTITIGASLGRAVGLLTYVLIFTP